MNFLDAVAGRPFTLAMAESWGISRGQVRTWADDGILRRVVVGVYVDQSVPDSIELRVAALALVLPSHAVVCDRTAAWLHGIDILDLAEKDVLPDVDVVSIGGKDGSSRDGVFGGKRALLPSDVMTINGILVTTPIRTACDLACLRGRWQAIAVLDAFRRAFAISEQDLMRLLPRYKRRRGCRQLRELLPLSTDQAESQPESWTRILIHDAGLLVPQPQVWVTVSDGRRFRIENAYEHLRIGVEYDSDEHHSSHDEVRYDDRRRGVLVDEQDWIILVIRKHDFGAQSRESWLLELEDAIARRCPDRPSKRIYARGPDDLSYQWRRRR